jgi:hypothetical protein
MNRLYGCFLFVIPGEDPGSRLKAEMTKKKFKLHRTRINERRALDGF